MTVKVLLFGSIGAAVGQNDIALSGVTDLNSVKEGLLAKYPELQSYTYRLAVNQQLCDSNPVLEEKDVVAVMPPFAGG